MNWLGFILLLLCAVLSGVMTALWYIRIDRGAVMRRCLWRHRFREHLLAQKLKSTAFSMDFLSGFLREAQEDSYERIIRETAVTALEKTSEDMCRSCGGCHMSQEQLERDSYYLHHMTQALQAGAPVEPEDLPEYFLDNCTKKEKYLEYLNRQLTDLETETDWRQRFFESRDVSAVQLEDFKRLLEQLAEFEDKPLDITDRWRVRFKKVCAKEGLGLSRLMILEYENTRLEIHMQLRTLGKQAVSVKKLVQTVQEIMNRRMRLASGSRRIISEDGGRIILETEPRYRVNWGAARRCMENGENSGDSFLAAEIPGNRMLLCLADGMGSGKLAESDSLKTAELVKNLLYGGVSPAMAVKLINSALLLRTGNTRPLTLDLQVIDLYTGRLECLKQGAPESFIFSGGSVRRLELTDVPIGWSDTIEPPVLTEKLKDGDYLFLVSDGLLEMLPRDDKEGAMETLLCQVEEDRPQALADKLMWAILGDEIPSDDMTLIVAAVERNSQITP